MTTVHPLDSQNEVKVKIDEFISKVGIIKYKHQKSYIEGHEPNKGGMSYGYYRDSENQKLVVAIAYCNPQDHFDRSIARSIINHRLAFGHESNVDVSIDIIKDGLSQFLANVCYHKDAIKSAVDNITIDNLTHKSITNHLDEITGLNDLATEVYYKQICIEPAC